MYCSNCGRELQDGEVCNCTKPAQAIKNEASENTAAENKTEKKPESRYDINRLFIAIVSVFSLIWELLKKPCSTVQAFMNRDNGKMGVKLMLVKAAIMYLYVLMYSSFAGKAINMNRVGMGIAVFVVSFALDFIFACIIGLCGRVICKKEIDTTATMEISGLKAGGETAGIIAAAVCSVFLPAISLVFILIGALFGMIISYTATLQLADIDKDKRVYIYITSLILMSVISIIVLTVVTGGLLINTFRNFRIMY